jgi:hypothetical protein
VLPMIANALASTAGRNGGYVAMGEAREPAEPGVEAAEVDDRPRLRQPERPRVPLQRAAFGQSPAEERGDLHDDDRRTHDGNPRRRPRLRRRAAGGAPGPGVRAGHPQPRFPRPTRQRRDGRAAHRGRAASTRRSRAQPSRPRVRDPRVEARRVRCARARARRARASPAPSSSASSTASPR